MRKLIILLVVLISLIGLGLSAPSQADDNVAVQPANTIYWHNVTMQAQATTEWFAFFGNITPADYVFTNAVEYIYNWTTSLPATGEVVFVDGAATPDWTRVKDVATLANLTDIGANICSGALASTYQDINDTFGALVLGDSGLAGASSTSYINIRDGAAANHPLYISFSDLDDDSIVDTTDVMVISTKFDSAGFLDPRLGIDPVQYMAILPTDCYGGTVDIYVQI